jgi:SAM-dependent methyltransferase
VIGICKIQRSAAGNLADNLMFPVRALFMGPKGYFGLSSLREERMRMVAKYCQGRVLDVGCGPGNLFINQFIGSDRGTGIDFYPYTGIGMLVDDPLNLPFEDGVFDTVTLIAVGGHIPREKRAAEFQELARVLIRGGRLLMTEGEPVTQHLVHAWYRFYLGLQGKQDVDSERGMEDGEEYCMPRQEIFEYLNTSPLKTFLHEKFMWGLNNIYGAEKIW